MANQSGTTYLHELSELLLCLQVTDSHGVVLCLDEGTSRAVGMVLSAKPPLKAMLIGKGSAAIVSHMQNDRSGAVGV